MSYVFNHELFTFSNEEIIYDIPDGGATEINWGKIWESIKHYWAYGTVPIDKLDDETVSVLDINGSNVGLLKTENNTDDSSVIDAYLGGAFETNSTSSINYSNVDNTWLYDPILNQSCLYSYKSSGAVLNGYIYGSIQLDIDFVSDKLRVSNFLTSKLTNVGGTGVSSEHITYYRNHKFTSELTYSDFEFYSAGTCPRELYVGVVNTTVMAEDGYVYFSTKKNLVEKKDNDVMRFELTKYYPEIKPSVTIKPNVITLENCEDVLGEELTGMLHDVVNIIKVLVPILLLVLGIVDFAKATFSSKEDDMKKVTSKFIKRVIIAIVIFLIPYALNILLSIADAIWGNIDPDLCGILK